jgi:glutamate formiminotransferase
MTRILIGLLIAVGVVGACSKKADDEAPPASPDVVPAAEVKRGQDACVAYVDKVCACAEKQPALKEQCTLAKSLPEAINTLLPVSLNSESSTRDVRQTAAAIRKTIKTCIEETAKLPAAGCP